MAPKKEKAVKAEPAKKTYKLNIFDALRSIDTQRFDGYSKLTDEEKKGFGIPVVMRWLSAVENKSLQPYYLTMVNEYVNADLWQVAKHPELVWKLMCVCGSGSPQRHVSITKKGSKRSTSKIDQFILQYNPSFNDMEIGIIRSRLTKEKLKELAENAGCTDEEIKGLLNELTKQE